MSSKPRKVEAFEFSPDKKRQKELKPFVKIFNKWHKYVKKKRSHVKEHLRHGIPPECRKALWMRMSGAEEMKSRSAAPYKEYRKMKAPPKVDEQIVKDLHRTFPQHELFKMPPKTTPAPLADPAETNGKRKKKRLEGYPKHLKMMYYVMRSFACYRPDIGYVQGMNYICGFFLTYFHNEEDTFWMFASLLENPKYDYEWIFTGSLKGLDEKVYIIDRFFVKFLPKLHHHLNENGIFTGYFAQKWILTLFCMHFPFNFVARVFDNFLLQGWRIVYKVALELLKTKQKELLGLTIDDLAPGFSTAEILYTDLDLDSFFKHALKLNIKPKKLEKYYKQYCEQKKIEPRIPKAFFDHSQQLVPAAAAVETQTPPQKKKSLLPRLSIALKKAPSTKTLAKSASSSTSQSRPQTQALPAAKKNAALSASLTTPTMDGTNVVIF